MAHCKYHPTENAIWYCGDCNVNFCHRCVPLSDSQDRPKCVLCTRGLEALAISRSVEPFWKQINLFFAFPLHTPILAYTVVLSMLMLFVEPGSWLFFVLVFFVFSLFMKLFTGITERVAEGQLAPPEFSDLTSLGNDFVFLRFVITLLAIGLFFNTVSRFVPEIIWLSAYFFVMVGMPAILMLLTLENSVASALNPGKIVYVMQAIGWPYAILYGFAFLLHASTMGAIGFLQPLLPSFLVFSIAMMVAGFFGCILFAMLGYVLYQYHYELGLSIDHSVLSENLSQQKTIDPALVEAEILIKEGRYQDASDRLESLLASNSKNFAAFEKVLQLKKVTGDEEGLVSFGRDYMTKLVGNRNPAKAVGVYQDILGVKPDFQIDSAEQCFSLAQGFLKAGQPKLAIKVCHNLHRRFPEYKRVDEVYFFLAKTFAEHMQNDGQAVKLLNFLVKNYSESKYIAEIKNYLASINQLNQKSDV